MLGKQEKAMLVRFNPKTDLHVKVIRSQIEPRQYHFFRVLRFPSFLLKVSSVMFFSVFFFGMSSDHLIFVTHWCNFFFSTLFGSHSYMYSTFFHKYVQTLCSYNVVDLVRLSLACSFSLQRRFQEEAVSGARRRYVTPLLSLISIE